MPYLLGLMIVAFGGCGLLLLVLFARELIRRLAARGRMLRAEGEVVDIVRKVAPRSPGRVRARTAYLFFPVITFTPDGGGPVTFRSEVGDGGRSEDESRYRVGDKLPVRYDPDGQFPPMLDTWSGVWLPPVMGLFAGLVFLGGAGLVAIVFADKVLGR